MNTLARTAGTVFGIGYLRPAPGTWGSLAALPLGWALHVLGGFPLLLLATAAIFIVGVWATTVIIEEGDDKDPSEIVIDEVAGQMIALLPLSYPAWSMGIPITALWPGWVRAFLCSRLFDIGKPGPGGRADRRGDALGVMLDDAIAGIFAALCVLIGAGVAHGLMGA